MIKIICLGKIKEQYLKDAINDYCQRIQKYHNIEIIELKDDPSISKETELIHKYFDKKNYNIALCIEGKEYSSIEFANHLDETFIYNSNICFFIGSSNGLDDSIIRECNERISFSKLTFPHGLFRIILLEQIYRAFKINNNERYHK